MAGEEMSDANESELLPPSPRLAEFGAEQVYVAGGDEFADYAVAPAADQVNPKRCGHLDGKDVVCREVAVRRIKAAAAARRDPAFVIAARTDAAAVTGLDDAVDESLSRRRR
jgi:2-methylisocitrate lyase-like PEP mutase family enzyme